MGYFLPLAQFNGFISCAHTTLTNFYTCKHKQTDLKRNTKRLPQNMKIRNIVPKYAS